MNCNSPTLSASALALIITAAGYADDKPPADSTKSPATPAASASAGALNRFVDRRLSAMPSQLRRTYLEQLRPFGGALSCEFAEDVAGMPGLARLKLSMRVPGGAAVSVLRHFRLENR